MSETAEKQKSHAIAGALAALLVGLSGFALAAQLGRDEEKEFTAAREGDLVQILDSLDSQRERLRAEIDDLQEQSRALSSDARGSQAALDEAHRRADDLAILAGTVAAKGPGLTIVLERDSKNPYADLFVDAIQELRGAGAEAIQISDKNGAAVRVVASTYVIGDANALDVDGTALSGPYTLTVIGDPPTMQAALSIPGGIVDTAHRGGVKITIDPHDEVTVSAIAPQTHPNHAEPED